MASRGDAAGPLRRDEQLPRTPGGKVDGRALAETGAGAAERKQEFIAARNRTEQVLVEIWCKVLGGR